MPKPVTPAPVEPAKPVPTEQVKPTPAEPVKPTPAEPVKPATELPAKPVPEDTVKPIPATPVAPTPAQPGPLAAGEELTIPYKKGNTRATVVEVNDDFVVVSYKSRSKKSPGDVKESILKSKYEELLKSGKIIRWTQERTRLMNKRPDYAPGLVEKVWEKAVKDSPDGIVRDPNTKEVLNWDKTKTRNGQWDMGHKKGAKYSDLVDSLVDGQITYEEFLKEYNDSMNYQPESKSANSSHEFE